MFEFHKNKEEYFRQQVENAKSFVIPFVQKHGGNVRSDSYVLEVGCGEAGVLKAFVEAGCSGIGVELSESRAGLARKNLSSFIEEGRVSIVESNIYNPQFIETYREKFDLIILKDVIEHIPDQQKIIITLKQFLKPGGKIFFGFPPWYMPFGGHQQICKNRWLSKLPYYHLLPTPLYKAVLRWGGESEQTIRELIEIKETGISIETFERYVRRSGMHIFGKTHYLFNPIYRYKFGVKPREQNRVIQSIPHIRNYLTTCVYYLVG